MRASRPSRLVNVGVVAAVAVAVGVTTLLVPTLEASFSARSTSRLTATWSATKVQVGTPATVRGRVTSGHLHSRPVGLYVYLKSGWRRAAHTTSGPRGYYALEVPTDYYLSRPMQVRSAATRRAKAVRTTARTFTVTPGYAAAGSAAAWSRQTPGQERRFDPCRTVTYRVKGASATARADVRAAFARVHEATGLTFRYLGTTTALPSAASAVPRDTNVVVAWAPQADSGGKLQPGDLSTDLVLATTAARDRQGAVRQIVGAAVLMNTGEDDYTSSMRQSILIHEIAHTVGLGHTTDPFQRMNEDVYPGESLRWGAGDIAGLGRLGIVEGCIAG